MVEPSEKDIAKPAPDPKGWEDWAKKATTARDMVLAGLGVVYVSGFFVWSFNSWRQHLGLVPISQVQYISAGLIPILMLAYAFRAYRNGLRNVPATKDEDEQSSYIRHVWTKAGLAWLAQAAVAAFAYWFDQSNHFIAVAIIWSSTMTLAGKVLSAEHATNRYSLSERSRAEMLFGYWCIFGLFIYATAAYPKIPQEFGGMQPRCAYIEVKRMDLSPTQRTVLLPLADQLSPKDPRIDPAPVVRSVPVDVLYDSGDAIELRPHAARDGMVYEIKRANIVSVDWCGYEFPKEKMPVSSAKSTAPTVGIKHGSVASKPKTTHK